MLSGMAGAAGNLLALEAFSLLTEFASTQSLGHILALDLLGMETSRHRLLRLPTCPECGGR
jgi:bacteriocin biosynthesis cyclodehydratase domain-containing protein